MPTPGKFLRGRVEADYNVSMSWDFEANLSDLSPDGIKVEPDKLGSVPLSGHWSFNLISKADGFSIDVKHGDLAYAAFGERVTATGELAYFANGVLSQIGTESWGETIPLPERDGDNMTFDGFESMRDKGELATDGKLPLAIQSSLQQYRFTITMTQDDSGAVETVTRSRSKRARGPSVTSAGQKPLVGAGRSDPKVDWKDSDDETDTFLVDSDWMSCTTTKQDAAEFNYQQIEVRETAYSTMCAVLLYLQTSHIEFAPIRTSHALSPNELVTECKAALSVYCLAHLLERDELQKMALDAFASSLTISFAAAELFNPVSLAYDKLRKVVIDFVVKNWKEVKATEAWQVARAKVTSAPSEGAAQVMFDVFAAVENT